MPGSDYVAEFDRDGFIQSDLESRMKAFQMALGGAQGPGAVTQNEVRGKMGYSRSSDPEADKLVTWSSTPNPPSPAGGRGDGGEGSDQPTEESPTAQTAPARRPRARKPRTPTPDSDLAVAIDRQRSEEASI